MVIFNSYVKLPEGIYIYILRIDINVDILPYVCKYVKMYVYIYIYIYICMICPYMVKICGNIWKYVNIYIYGKDIENIWFV